MARPEKLLSAAKVKAIKAKKQPGRHSDGGGLYLEISKWGTAHWIYRYHRNGRTRHMGLGSAEIFTLQEARTRRDELRKQLKAGQDPLEERDKAREVVRRQHERACTFDEAAAAYIEEMRPSWRNEKHDQQWSNTLATYVSPKIGSMQVAKIETSDVMRVLKPHWRSKPETMSRVRARIEAILNWAGACDLRDGPNPAKWGGHLQYRLPARRKIAPVKHHPALDYQELPALMQALRAEDSVAAKALEFTILVCVRSDETFGARWDEFDLDAAVWTIPAYDPKTGRYMKAGKEHRVPLSPRAMEILHEMAQARRGPVVFATEFGKPLPQTAMRHVLKRLRPGVTVHGMRAAFSTWTAERTHYPTDVREACLAHSDKNQSRAAYQRGPLLVKRRKLMEFWADYCAAPAPAGDVIPLHQTRA